MNAKEFLTEKGIYPSEPIYWEFENRTIYLHELMDEFAEAYASKDNFFCEEQVNGYKKCETQCDYCKDKPKIQKV